MHAVGAFQRIITKIVDEDNLEIILKRNMTINEDKSIREADCLNILGYQIKHQQISPDQDRLKPLMEIPVPSTTKELKRVRGLLAYYSKWIANFSTKI